MKRVYIDKSLETRLEQVKQRRGDKNVNKTVKDLLRERVLFLDESGDPFSLRKKDRQPEGATA